MSADNADWSNVITNAFANTWSQYTPTNTLCKKLEAITWADALNVLSLLSLHATGAASGRTIEKGELGGVSKSGSRTTEFTNKLPKLRLLEGDCLSATGCFGSTTTGRTMFVSFLDVSPAAGVADSEITGTLTDFFKITTGSLLLFALTLFVLHTLRAIAGSSDNVDLGRNTVLSPRTTLCTLGTFAADELKVWWSPFWCEVETTIFCGAVRTFVLLFSEILFSIVFDTLVATACTTSAFPNLLILMIDPTQKEL